MLGDFGCLAAQAGPSPVLYITVYIGPIVKASCFTESCFEAWMGCVVDVVGHGIS